jgi:hypothetical protein
MMVSNLNEEYQQYEFKYGQITSRDGDFISYQTAELVAVLNSVFH